MRGNLRHRPGCHYQGGSIPACAGEPPSVGFSRDMISVYPRVCGGTTPTAPFSRSIHGLSPRVRGNRSAQCPAPLLPRSIPACAGEPTSHGEWMPLPQVYPRVCGGTGRPALAQVAIRGLSPRVRGNHIEQTAGMFMVRSIPACAGEPMYDTQTEGLVGVYPRVCGGTHGAGTRRPPGDGLSPRVRGNQRRPRPGLHMLGSIPACAGEPTRGRAYRHCTGVYPRVCGGTAAFCNHSPAESGLSPRVRGNRAGATRF